ncbi:circadian clock-controlled protein daywake-like [Anticarsia gemmatalis]|uniref:circadian clock-controlled protein daywake-like n=1 Tax=Anticarsia gemmatalis TaxID=129554 RepID=UPI003F759708
MCNIKILISCLVLSCVVGSFAGKAPSYIKACVGLKSDCLKKTVQETLPLFSKGIPELGVDPIDPLRQGRIDLTLPGGFKVELNNGSFTGLRKCTIEDVSFANDQADLKVRCDITIKGTYKAKGNILIVTINGDGDAKIKIKNASLQAKIRFEDKVRDGVVYYEVKDFDTTFTYGDKVTFGLTNLFKGSPELSEAVLLFLNQNWKQVADEFGRPIVDKLIDIVYNIVKKFFEQVPKDELFIL